MVTNRSVAAILPSASIRLADGGAGRRYELGRISW